MCGGLPFKIALVVYLITFCYFIQVVSAQDYETHQVPVSQDYIDAIDAATQEMIVDTTFTDTFYKLMYFTVPTCVSAQVAWPKTNPFSDRKGLVMCIDLGGLGYPFQDARLLVANTLVKKINNHYGVNLQTYVKYVNTTANGFFNSMKAAVNNGTCDVISVNVEQTEERKKAVHFQCPWGTTSKAFLRTERDPHLELLTFSSLNQSQVKVATYAGTSYETDVKKNLPAAQYVPFGSPDYQWTLIRNKEVHAVVYNAVTFLTWLTDNRADCKNCSVVFINQPYGFSTFTTNLIKASEATNMLPTMVNSIVLMLVILMIHVL